MSYKSQWDQAFVKAFTLVYEIDKEISIRTRTLPRPTPFLWPPWHATRPEKLTARSAREEI